MSSTLLTSVAGPGPFSIYQGDTDPNGVLTPIAGPGALLVRNDAGNCAIYLNVSTNVWVVVGGAGGALYPDNIPITFGTSVLNQWTERYNSVSTLFEIAGASISAAAATQATRGMSISPGTRTTTDANAGQSSGNLTFTSGPTVQTGVANGGPSGTLAVTSGTTSQQAVGVGGTSGAAGFGSGATDATVAGATGGNSGVAVFSSGNTDVSAAVAATGGDTGITTLSSGAAKSTGAGATSGKTGKTVVTTGDSADSSAGDVVVAVGAGKVGIARVLLGNAPSATDPQPSVVAQTIGAIELNGTDNGTRLVLDEDFVLAPALAANLATSGASKTFEALGTNLAANTTFDTSGGIVLATTGGTQNNQCAVRGHMSANQGMWSSVLWSTSKRLRLKCSVLTPATITSMRAGVGAKLTVIAGATLLDLSDANGIWFGYDTAGLYNGNVANWNVVIRIGGVSTLVNTTVVFAASTSYQLVLDVDTNQVARFYIDGALVATSTPLAASIALTPFAAVQTLDVAGAVRQITVRRMAASKAW